MPASSLHPQQEKPKQKQKQIATLISYLQRSATKHTYMATSMGSLVMLCLVSPLLLAGAVHSDPWWYGLFPQFYDRSCPQAKDIVRSIVAQAVAREPRMAASLVRLHFHDCFVKGCDASVLLDNSSSIVGGPYWQVPLGRRDSLGANIQGSNNDIPAPNDTLPTIITKFKLQGLNLVDVVALSG
ncbi:hypothetical protein ABZP36_028018 [Zizania latifolia]